MSDNILLCFVLWNLAVFLLYGVDKYKAIKKRWRISEKILLSSAFLMGAAGAVFGMEFFRHKTKKKMFRALVLAAFILNVAVYMKMFE